MAADFVVKCGEQGLASLALAGVVIAGEFAEKYFRKGLKVLVTGRIQTGSYTNRDGVKVYTTDVVVEDQEFAESKNSNSAGADGGYNGGYGGSSRTPEPSGAGDGFMNIPDGIDEELPFN